MFFYDNENIKISLDIPLDTGKGDNTYSIISYYLEYKDSSIINSQYREIYCGTDRTYYYIVKNNKFIYEHTYKFKISCLTERENSSVYSEFKYLYSSKPSKP